MTKDPLTSVRIRKAKQGDALPLAIFLRSLAIFNRINSEQPDIKAERIDRHLTICLADNSHSIYIASSADCELVGYISIHWLPYLILRGLEGFVSELFIHANHRGNGIGRQLLESAKCEATDRGCSRLSLINFRDRDSYRRGFYAKNGWEERLDAANFVINL